MIAISSLDNMALKTTPLQKYNLTEIVKACKNRLYLDMKK